MYTGIAGLLVMMMIHCDLYILYTLESRYKREQTFFGFVVFFDIEGFRVCSECAPTEFRVIFAMTSVRIIGIFGNDMLFAHCIRSYVDNGISLIRSGSSSKVPCSWRCTR